MPLSGVSGRSHSSMEVTTDSEGHFNDNEKETPVFNGIKMDGETSSDSSWTRSLDVGNTSGLGILTCIPFLRYLDKEPPSSFFLILFGFFH